MPRQVRSILLILLGIVLSLLAILGREHLPARELDLTSAERKHYLLQFNGDTAHPVARWLNEGRLEFQCRPLVQEDNQTCGISFALGVDQPSQGMDLRRYDTIELDLAYQGEANNIRLAIRDFDARFSKALDYNSTRYHSLNLRVSDLGQPISIKLNELTVPEWWIGQYNLPREFNLPDLSNATLVTIDVPLILVKQAQTLQVRRLRLRGEWVGAEIVYLTILCLWLLGAAVFVAWRLIALHRRHRQQKREIAALLARTQQLSKEQSHLRQRAMLDELTGQLNRRGLEGAIGSLRDRHGPHAVIVLDLDHFKRINDTLGHAAGDLVLRTVAGVMAREIRAHDVLVRWGGEEFVVICLDCTAAGAASVAEKIRARIAATGMGEGGDIQVTVSLGVALMPTAESFSQAFRLADMAMYRAKTGGRNRVELADPDSPQADTSPSPAGSGCD